MKLGIIKFVFVFACHGLTAQNLVVNPSFEDDTLLNSFLEVDSFFCSGWYLPNDCSPDFFTLNKKDNLSDVPSTLFGNHLARTGKSYIGIIPIAWDGAMEHLSGTLKEPLEKGKKYRVQFYVRYAGIYAGFTVNKMGLTFSEDKYLWNFLHWPFYHEILTPLIQENIGNEQGFLTNDTSWQLISGEYNAHGGEKYFTIGIFYEDEWSFESLQNKFLHLNGNKKKEEKFFKKNQHILRINPCYISQSNFPRVPYYFIDDVSVELIED